MPAKRKPGPDPLSTYRAKRSLDRTPEPGARPATPAPSAGGLFVVHMHAARRLHWDLRLEMDGVLRSWAVPKGPSPKRADQRLAVHVEDQPLESVLSRLRVEELKAGKDRAAPLEKELTRLKAPRRAVAVEEAEPMLAETREQPFSKPGWLFELKLDGYRVRAARQAGEARLVTRNGHDIAPAFPEIARALAALPYEGLIVDGELVVPDEAGRPSFQRLQNPAKVPRAL